MYDRIKNKKRPDFCPVCKKQMGLIGKLPAVGGVPELLSYQCPDCKVVMTLEGGPSLAR